jgi:hypothetical protein
MTIEIDLTSLHPPRPYATCSHMHTAPSPHPRSSPSHTLRYFGVLSVWPGLQFPGTRPLGLGLLYVYSCNPVCVRSFRSSCFTVWSLIIPTPISARKSKTLDKTPPIIVSRREEDAVLKEVVLSRYRWARCILETKSKVGRTVEKTPVPHTNPKNYEAPTSPKPPTHPSHLQTPRRSTPSSSLGSTPSSIYFHFAVHLRFFCHWCLCGSCLL